MTPTTDGSHRCRPASHPIPRYALHAAVEYSQWALHATGPTTTARERCVLNEPTHERLSQLALTAMATAWKEQHSNVEYGAMPSHERLAVLVEALSPGHVREQPVAPAPRHTSPHEFQDKLRIRALAGTFPVREKCHDVHSAR